MASSVGPSALWYLTRGTGAVALVLLTMSVALGVANVRRVHTERVPRFVVDAVQRELEVDLGQPVPEPARRDQRRRPSCRLPRYRVRGTPGRSASLAAFAEGRGLDRRSCR